MLGFELGFDFSTTCSWSVGRGVQNTFFYFCAFGAGESMKLMHITHFQFSLQTVATMQLWWRCMGIKFIFNQYQSRTPSPTLRQSKIIIRISYCINPIRLELRHGFRSESEGIDENRVNTVGKVFLIIKVTIEKVTIDTMVTL